MRGGDLFAEVIQRAVSNADVLIALIGDRWLDACDDQGAVASTIRVMMKSRNVSWDSPARDGKGSLPTKPALALGE
jgi:hypothetical protein